MTELKKQVQRAQRRINLQSFLSASVWSLAICLGIAALALGITKIWHLEVDPRQWQLGWLGGSVVVGVLAAAVWAWFRKRDMVDAAIEIDRRFGLKERVSSSLSLSAEEAESKIGQALVADAARKVERIDVAEEFGLKANRWAFLPFLVGALAVALVFLPDAKPSSSRGEASAKTVEVKKVKRSTDVLKKKLADKKKELEEKNLKEASKLAEKLEKGVNELSKQNADKKKTMIEMNNLAKMLKQRRESMKGSEDLKKQLNQLKDMKVTDGPADKLARAMQNGDFKNALEQVKGLQQQLKNGNLNAQQMAQLAEQMNQMQQKMNEIIQRHEQDKKKLQQQIADAEKRGDKQAAQKLQEKLEQKQAQDQAMQKMQQMANKMQQAAQQMQQAQQQGKQGQQQAQQQAAQQLAQMAQELGEMAQEMAELEALDEMLDQLADAKQSANCPQCDGSGCQACQGLGGFGNEQGQIPGMGMGEGQGRGDRPEEKTDNNFYDTKVQANIRKGKLVVTGNVSGPNKPGEALEAIKEAMAAAETSDENPLNNVRLPKAQLEQAQQYFDSVRGGVK